MEIGKSELCDLKPEGRYLGKVHYSGISKHIQKSNDG